MRGIHAAESPAGVWAYQMQDGLGSVRSVIDEDGLVVQAIGYTPYGVADSSYEWGFTGEQRDGTDIQYHRTRYYNPSLGVWANLDILETNNRYSYVGGNVINQTDRVGLCPENPWWNDIPGNRCVWLANELSQKYNFSYEILMQKDVAELEGIYALGNLNNTFNESAWSQAVRDNPVGAVGIAGAATVGAAAIIATGGAATPIVLGIASGATVGAVSGGVISRIPAGLIYDLAHSKKCGRGAKLWADSVDREYFIQYSSSQGAMGGAITGGVAATGPVGVALAGGGNALVSALGGADSLNKIIDAINQGDEVSACELINLALGVAGTALGLHGGLRGIRGQQVQSTFLESAKETSAVCWNCSSRSLGGPKTTLPRTIQADLEAAGFRQTRFPRPYTLDIWQLMEYFDDSPEPYIQPYHATIRLSWFWERLVGLSNNVRDQLTNNTPPGGIYDYALLPSFDPKLLNASLLHYLPPNASLRYPYLSLLPIHVSVMVSKDHC
jgi:RHS repeat-associated protein